MRQSFGSGLDNDRMDVFAIRADCGILRILLGGKEPIDAYDIRSQVMPQAIDSGLPRWPVVSIAGGVGKCDEEGKYRSDIHPGVGERHAFCRGN